MPAPMPKLKKGAWYEVLEGTKYRNTFHYTLHSQHPSRRAAISTAEEQLNGKKWRILRAQIVEESTP